MSNDIFNPVNFYNEARHIITVIQRTIPGLQRSVMMESDTASIEDAICEVIVGYNADQNYNEDAQFIHPDGGENALVDDLAKQIIDAIEESKDGQAVEVYGVPVIWTKDRYPLPQGEWYSEQVYDVLYAAMFGGECVDGSEDRDECLDWAFEEVDWSDGRMEDHWVRAGELREMLGAVFDEAQRRHQEESEEVA